VVVAENYGTLNNTENVRFLLEHKRSLWEALLCWEEPDSDRSSLSEASSTIGHTCYPPISPRQRNWSDSSIFSIWVPAEVRGNASQSNRPQRGGTGFGFEGKASIIQPMGPSIRITSRTSMTHYTRRTKASSDRETHPGEHASRAPNAT